MTNEQEPQGCYQFLSTLWGRYVERVYGPQYQPTNLDLVTRAFSDTGAVPHAPYYSGIPANREWISEEHLFKTYEGIKQRLGEAAAFNYANMIIDMPNLAPSHIIASTLRFAENDCVYDPEKPDKLADNRPGYVSDTDDLELVAAEAYLGFVASLADIEDETELIRTGFIDSFDKEELEKIRNARNIIRPD